MTVDFLESALAWLKRYLSKKPAPWRSKFAWRLDAERSVPREENERKLAYRLCADLPAMFREIPAASGIVDWEAFDNRHANVDLVREIRPGEEYELIELKLNANTPEYAAAQAVRNGLLYLLARTCSPESFRASRPLLRAKKVRLRVWAPQAFYTGFQGWIIESAISGGFASISDGLIDEFKFEANHMKTGNPEPVDWKVSAKTPRQRIHHVPGPFRVWLQRTSAHRKGNNFFDPEWKFLVPRHHPGINQPDSSQAFSVNLFAPMKQDPGLARDVLSRIAPGQGQADDSVAVDFEVSFPEIAQRLNEKGISTQVDVVFTIGNEEVARKLLVEVKLAEEQFGGCKGWFDSDHPPTRNPDRSLCRKVMDDPEHNCYLAQRFSRKYWEHLLPSLKLLPSDPCPFRGSLYQLMRNYATAKVLGSAQFIVCLHPENDQVRTLDLPVSGNTDAVQAFQAILGPDAVHVWNARTVIEETTRLKPELSLWREWMLKTYFGT